VTNPFEPVAAAIRTAIDDALLARYRSVITGRLISSTQVQLSDLTLGVDRMYCRSDYDSRDEIVVNGAASAVNIPVWIEKMPDGKWRYVCPDYSKAIPAIGAALSNAALPPAQKTALEGTKFKPGSLRASSAGALYVYLEPHFYFTRGGSYVYFPGGDLDLTSNIPGTANQWRWVIICIDTTTNALVAVNGTAKSTSLALDVSEIDDIAIGAYLPRKAIKLRNGQTFVMEREDDIADCAVHFDGAGKGIKNNYAATGDPAVTDDSGDGYEVGSIWINVSAGKIFTLVDATVGAAVWQENIAGTTSWTGSRYDPFAKPASPDAQDDEFDNSSLAGAWTEYDFGSKLTVSEDARGLLFTHTGGSVFAYIMKALPAGNGTLTTYTSLNVEYSEANNITAGIVLAQGTANTSDLATFYLVSAAGMARTVAFDTYNDYSAAGYSNLATQTVETGRAGMFLRLRRTSTTYAADFSTDGIGWTRIYSGTLPFTPAYMGLVMGNNAGATTHYARFQYFRYTGSDVGREGTIGGQRVYYRKV